MVYPGMRRNGMNSKFFDLSKEKQDRMINAALKVFALNGYRHASTDDIVREAGISKGLLFHYFQNKIGVYDFVYDYSVRYMKLELSMIPKTETDLFELFRYAEEAHMRATKEYPYMKLFMDRTRSEDVSEALLYTEKKKEAMEAVYDDLYSRADYAAFPVGVDGEKVRSMLEYTITGIMTERFLNASFQPEMLYEEICGYLDMMKRIFQK